MAQSYPVVAVLLCWELRRRPHRDHPPVHRTAANATLTTKSTATPSALSFPGLKAEACRAPGHCIQILGRVGAGDGNRI